MYWQTLHYEGWLEDKDRALPVVLETQCSERKLLLFDASYGSGRRCEQAPEKGIHYCGDPAKDVDRRGRPLESRHLCASITDRNGATDILDLQGEVLLNLQCRPRVTEVTAGDEKINLDYLKHSSQPYVVSTKSVPGKDVDIVSPTLSNHPSICDPDS